MSLNLVLEDDAALGGVVGALAGLGSHILALRKSEPSLEDVFVELVGRGFDDDESGPDASAEHRAPSPRIRATRPHEPGEPSESEVALTSAYALSRDREPARGRRLDAAARSS